MTSGSAKLVSPDGAVSKISGNETLNLDTKSNAASIVQRTIAPLYPAPGARFVSSADNATITFRAKSSGETEKWFFEISKDGRFGSVEKSEVAAASPEGIISASVGVTLGSWYWRIRAESGEVSSVSRFSVLASRPPGLLWPEDRASIRFRKNVSPVGFSWTESPGASSYALEISRDSRGLSVARKLSSALPGITVTDLAEGTWFWRAIPIFPEGTVGTVEASALREIRVTRSGEMRALRQIVPADGGFYEIRNGIVNDIGFSWEPEADAVAYELSFFSAADRMTPLATYPTDRTWLSLDASKSPFLAKIGSYFWSVSWKDAEGNVSPASTLRRIDGVDGRSAIRPVFPPDGYTAEESLVPNIRFVWKSNMNARTVLQLSQDPSFAKVSAEKNATGNFLEGIACKAGMWYWRLVSYNADGSVFLLSESRSLRVSLPFGSPLLERPAPGSAIEVLDGESVRFSWTRIGGADYYSCKLYSPDAASAPLFSAEYLDGHECEIPLGTFPEGTYHIVLQAFARDSEAGTRIVGIPGSVDVSAKKIYPVEIISPKDGAEIAGLVARRKGVLLEWRSAEMPDALSIVVTRDNLLYPVSFAWKPGMKTFMLANLGAGSYTWKVRARHGIFDISSKDQPSFIILPAPLLPAPTIMLPAGDAVIDYSYIEIKKNIRFEWKPVAGATDYALRILSSDRHSVLFRVDRLKSTSYTLENLSCLDRGNFIWEVSAQNYWTDGKMDQAGAIASSRFSINLPALPAPELKLRGAEYYGY